MIQALMINKQTLQAFRVLQILEQRYPDLCSAAELSYDSKIPKETLYKILSLLTSKNWIMTTLGRSGGYSINRRYCNIATVRSLINAFGVDRVHFDESTDSKFLNAFEMTTEVIDNFYLELPLLEAITEPPIKEIVL